MELMQRFLKLVNNQENETQQKANVYSPKAFFLQIDIKKNVVVSIQSL